MSPEDWHCFYTVGETNKQANRNYTRKNKHSGGWNEMSPTILDPQLVSVWAGLGSVSLLDELCPWGLGLKVSKDHDILS